MFNARHYSILDSLEKIKSEIDPTLSFRRNGPLSGVIVNGAVVEQIDQD